MAEDVFGIVGSVIAGAYQVEAVVAEGGFGVVYRAQHVGFRAPVALKCLKVPQQLGPAHEAEFLEQFRAEAELLFRLSASIPTVVRPLHVDALTAPDGRFVPFMALEWLQGETLDQIVQRRVAEGRPPMSLKKLVRLLGPAARALERAHNFIGPEGPISVVHRDLKPENIFVASVAGEEIVKVLDFGIAKAKSVASQVVGRASQTQSALTAFTPAYGAPEQWLPKRFGQTGPWTDVWGFALTMVEVLVQRNVFEGDPAAMMGAAIDPVRRPTPRTEGADVSDAAEAVFARALAVDPRERYRDAGEFWAALCASLGVRPDEDARASVAARDARAEPGLVPRVETIEAAQRPPPSTSGFRARSSAPPEAETQPAIAAHAAGGEGWPMAPQPVRTPVPPASPASPLGPVAPTPAPDSIPDLAPAPKTSLRPTPSSRTSIPMSRDLDLDLSSSEGLDLALDVDNDPALAHRISRPEIDVAATAPADPAARARVASGSHPIAPVASTPPRSAISGAHPAVSISNPPTPALHSMPAAPQPEPTILRRLAPGMSLVALSIVVTLADQAYAAATGEIFALGPVRTMWISALLMVGGVGIIIHRLIQQQKG
jgi:serine/threonine-protein kinase